MTNLPVNKGCQPLPTTEPMKTALFVPCYIDQFYPQVAVATLELLEKLGCQVDFPLEQTCCGQPMANSGCEGDALATAALFVRNFAQYDYVTGPSGSCVLHVREHFNKLPPSTALEHLRKNTFELSEFLHKVLKVESFPKAFPHKVGLHLSCHGQRGLRLAQSSEIVGTPYSVLHSLLAKVKGLELVSLGRPDECCGFGGTFAVSEATVSVKMGKDRLDDHLLNGAEIIAGGDVSCLMHLEGILKHQGKNVRVMHFAEILNQAMP